MSDFDLVIRGGAIVTAADTARADVGGRNGVIAVVADAIDDGRKSIDASGLLVTPGGIDSHARLAETSGAPPAQAKILKPANGTSETILPQGTPGATKTYQAPCRSLSPLRLLR